jgi:hypothetical protein
MGPPGYGIQQRKDSHGDFSRAFVSRLQIFRDVPASNFVTPQIVPTAARTAAGQPGLFLRPGLSCIVASKERDWKSPTLQRMGNGAALQLFHPIQRITPRLIGEGCHYRSHGSSDERADL